MYIVLLLLAASTLLGLATGFIFRFWVNLLVAPLVAVISTIALRFYGFGFAQSVLVAVACLFISQLAYGIGSFLESEITIAKLLARDAFDYEPDDAGDHATGDKQKKRDEHPS